MALPLISLFLPESQNRVVVDTFIHSLNRLALFAGVEMAIISLLVILLIPDVSAQKKQVNHEHQQWLQYNNFAQLNQKWSVQSSAGYRWRGGFREPAQYIIRTSAQFQANEVLHLAAGFGINGAYALGKVNRIEYRPYQDVAMRTRLGKVEVSHRYRIEERFFQFLSESKVQDKTDFILRLRYALTLNIPLINLGSQDANKKISFNIADEIFFNAGKNIVYNIFDQNRITLGPSFQMNRHLIFSLTWNSQYGTTPDPDLFRSSDAIWLQVRHRVNFHKSAAT